MKQDLIILCMQLNIIYKKIKSQNLEKKNWKKENRTDMTRQKEEKNLDLKTKFNILKIILNNFSI